MEYNSNLFSGGGIPDAATIHAARKKREALRDAGGGGASQDYLPIKKADDESGRAKRGPRLVREEDEEEGEEDRVSFTLKEAARSDEYHRRAARHRSGSGSDSEPETWEKNQISKAINNQQVSASFSLYLEIALSVSMLGGVAKNLSLE